MKYKSYPEYKDSGVEWLGEIPKHWNSLELKRYSHVQGGYAFNSDSFADSGEAVIRIGDIKQDGSISLDSCKYISIISINDYKQYQIKKGDLLMAMTGATIGKAGRYESNQKALLNQRVGAFRCNKDKLNFRFYWYVLNSYGYQEYIKLTAFGGAQPNISDAGMVGYKAAIPSLNEQKQIAAFLDRETAKIDTLIEKQQQLIKLLKEKRQAVISHAVTKGLNPNAPMRDSGITWLGKIPAHWLVAKVKYFASIQGGYAFNSDSFQERGVQLLRIGNVYLNRLALERQPVYVDKSFVKSHKGFSVRRGDILMSLTGTLGKTDYGFAVLVNEDGPFMLNQRVAKISPFVSKIVPEYLIYAIRSESYLKQLYSLPSGTKQANLSNDDVINIPVVVPPTIEEQQRVSQYISDNLGKYNTLIKKSDSAIKLIQERRTALISAAVTGKIDVRG